MDLKLSFAKTAYSLLDQSSDHVALKKLCTYLLEELEKNHLISAKYSELLMKNEAFAKGQQLLEKELINYKLKFEEISKKLSSYENAVVISVPVAETKLEFSKEKPSIRVPWTRHGETVTFDYPPVSSQTEANESIRTDPSDDEYQPFVSHQQRSEEFAFMLKDHLKNDLIGNKIYYEEFKEIKPTIEGFVSTIVKKHKEDWRAGNLIPSVKPGKASIGFTHILPQNKEDSIFLITSSNQTKNTRYHLIPQTAVENMLKLGDAKALKYPQYIMKEMKELVEFSIVKIGKKNYWLDSIVTMMNSLKEVYLKSQNMKSENTKALSKLKGK